MHISDKPSEALRQALGDLEKCEKDPRLEVCMWEWALNNGRTCQVCLAGAILVQQEGIPSRWAAVEDLPIDNKMRGIDQFRAGRIWAGVQAFCTSEPIKILSQPQRVEGIEQYMPGPAYEDDAEGFKAYIRSIADALERIDL